MAIYSGVQDMVRSCQGVLKKDKKLLSVSNVCTYINATLNELSLGTNFMNNNDCLHCGQLLWPSSGCQSSWPKCRQSLLFMKLVPRESSFDM